MIQSMTAFAAAKADTDLGELSLEIRSLNHRFLEVGLRLPEELRAAEPALRDAVAGRLGRGKVDLSVRLRRRPGTAGGELRLNRPLAEQLDRLGREAGALFADARPGSLPDWLRWPGLVEETEPDLSPLAEALSRLLDEALGELVAHRCREGERLAALVGERLDAVAAEVGRVRGWLPEIRDAQRARLDDKIAQLTQNLDPERLEQEVAIVLQKLDVDEELDRLDTHVAEARRSLDLSEPVGRRLDFLMQELNREANTLGSKSVDARTTQASVDLKVLIEQMREQIQNIE